jgi:uncharacterized protein
MQTPKVILLGSALLLAGGLSAGGYFIGQGISHRNDSSREISVKGLSEKEVPASIAIWTIAYSASGNDLAEINQKLAGSTKTVQAFLKTSGFDGNDVAIQPPLIRDLSLDARDKDALPPTVRYIATQSVLLRTAKVDFVKPAVAAVSQLIAAGVELSGRNDPDYSFNRLNEIKPEMIAEATKNARTAAEQFSRDAATQLGSLRSAQQGWFQVESRDIATPERKIVRVVVDVVFEIK